MKIKIIATVCVFFYYYNFSIHYIFHYSSRESRVAESTLIITTVCVLCYFNFYSIRVAESTFIKGYEQATFERVASYFINVEFYFKTFSFFVDQKYLLDT